MSSLHTLGRLFCLWALAALAQAAELAPANADALGFSAPRLARIDQRIQAEIAHGDYPGAVLLIARHGKLAHMQSYGRLGPDQATPMPQDAIFRLYSMTKPLTSVAIMQLVEEGRLHLDDPLSQYIPAFQRTQVQASGNLVPARPVTIQDLLRHTAGMSYGFLNRSPAQRAYAQAQLWNDAQSNAEFVERLAAMPLDRQPGEAWEYSHATDVLGRVIEVVSGQSLSSYLKTRLLEPLGMHDTGFVAASAEQQARLAEAYPKDRSFGSGAGRVDFYDPRQPRRWESGGAGLISTAGDYARFLQMLLNGGSFNGQRILGPKTVAWLTADQLAPHQEAFAGYGWSLGFAVRRTAGAAAMPGSVGDYFWFGAGGTSFWVDPKEDMFVIFMAYQPSAMDAHHTLLRQMVYAAMVK